MFRSSALVALSTLLLATACGQKEEPTQSKKPHSPTPQSLAATSASHMVTGDTVNIRDARLNILDTANYGEKLTLTGRSQDAMGHTFLEVNFVDRSNPKTGWIAKKYIGNISTDTPAGERHIVVNLSKNRLFYYEDGELVRSWNVGTARAGKETPAGHYTIREKEVCPPYFGPAGDHNTPGCTPENPFGPRVLWFIGTMYGIHGTNQPWLIEDGTDADDRRVSGGCVRNENENIMWLYNRVEEGDPIDIVW
jgi:lipoprotein-anchoring transpeptidase ErfK/SrfK